MYTNSFMLLPGLQCGKAPAHSGLRFQRKFISNRKYFVKTQQIIEKQQKFRENTKNHQNNQQKFRENSNPSRKCAFFP